MDRSGLRFTVIALLLMGVLSGIGVFDTIPNGVLAQQDTGDTPIEGTRYDSYPHPSSPGALAYKLADRWDRTDLTFYFVNCPYAIDCDAAWDAVRAGFQSWADETTLTFTEVNNPRNADIELSWSNQGPELGRPGDVLAYATLPRDGGDVVFDDSEPWRIFDGSEFDLFLVATHEIGHALGLDHSSIPTALMYPVINQYTQGITDDDSAAIQALYGLPRQNQTPQNLPQQPAGADSVGGEINDFNLYEVWEFEVYAGETVTVTMQTTSGDLIPYVGILTNDEQTVLVEDGANDNEYTVQVTYTFEQAGIYVVVATRQGVEEGYSSGTYTLSLESVDTLPEAQQPAAESGDILVDLRSYTVADLCEAYVTPVGSGGQRQDRLSSRMTNGNSISFAVSPGAYDILIVGCDGTTMQERNVQISQDLAIEVYDNDINIYIYGT